MSDGSRTLFVHTGGIGDFLLACPALSALSAEGPVDLLGDPARLKMAGAAGIAAASHDIDRAEFHTIFSEISDGLRRFLGQYGRAVVWMRDDDGSIREGLRDCGVGDVVLEPGLPPAAWRRHASEYYLERLGLPPTLLPRMEFPASTEEYEIVLHPGSGSRDKNWPAERFLELAKCIEARGRDVVWCLGPAEREDLELLERLGTTKRLPALSLVELGSVLSAAGGYVGNDSGITHLAGAVGCPVVALFGVTDPRVWAPLGEHVHVLRQESATVEEIAELLA